MGALNANVTQRVGDGSRRYIFTGDGPGGGDLAVWADNAAQANEIIRFIRGLNGVPTVHAGEIIANPNMDPWAAPPPPEEPPYSEEPLYYDDGGYGLSSVGGGRAPRPPYDVNTDPGYQAFLAALGQSDEAARRAAANRTAEIDQQAATSVPRIQEGGVEARRRISGEWENRGLFRSGARLRDLALQQRGESQQISDVEQAAARQKAGLQDSLQQQIADLARQRAEKALELTTAHAY